VHLNSLYIYLVKKNSNQTFKMDKIKEMANKVGSGSGSTGTGTTGTTGGAGAPGTDYGDKGQLHLPLLSSKT